jgi:2-oxoglutarate ferredoxin oxidoreductase subunit beta
MMLNEFKDKAVTTARAKNLSEEELVGKAVIGVLHNDESKTEFCDEYQKVVDHHRVGA